MADFFTPLPAEDMRRVGFPPLVLPSQVPIDQGVTGELVGLLPSPYRQFRGMVLWLRHQGAEFLFPWSGNIRRAITDPVSLVGHRVHFVRRHNPLDSVHKRYLPFFDIWTSQKT